MILQDEIEITCSGKNKPYLENLGYSLPYTKDNRGRVGIKKGTKIIIKLKDVPKNSNIKIKYQCDSCNKIFESSISSIFGRCNSQYLKTGKTYCVKCSPKIFFSGENNPRYKHGNIRFPEYRNNARRRGISFELTSEEFKNITSKPCFYCGGYSSDRNPKSRGNGIDRKDSKIGYVLSNCVPCCATCNFVKNNMGYSDFILYIRKLYERTKNYEI